MNQSGATGSPAAYREAKATKGNWIVGLTNEVVDKLGNFASDEVPEYLADEIVPRGGGALTSAAFNMNTGLFYY